MQLVSEHEKRNVQNLKFKIYTIIYFVIAKKAIKFKGMYVECENPTVIYVILVVRTSILFSKEPQPDGDDFGVRGWRTLSNEPKFVPCLMRLCPHRFRQ